MTQVTIAATTDVHGYLDEGLAGLPAALASEGVDLLIDNGDFFVGSPFAAYGYDQKKISPLVTLANELSYDVMVPGNHDLDFGLAWLKQQVSALEADYVCANLKDVNGNRVFPAYSIQAVKGLKVAVIGLMTGAFNQLCPLEVAKEVIVENPLEVLGNVLEDFKANAVAYDLLVVSYHGGLTNDPETGATWFYPSLEDQAYQLMSAFPDINSLICGHQHFTNVACHPHGIACLQVGTRGQHLGLQRFALGDDAPLADQAAHKGGGTGDRLKLVDNRLLDLRTNATLYPLGAEREAFQAWLDKPVEIDAIRTWLKDQYPADLYLLDFNSKTLGDFTADLAIPFPLSYYYAPGKEIMSLSDSYDSLDLEQFYTVLATTGSLPQTRLREGLLLPLFDEIIKHKAY